jgi:hypothetical protein
MAMTPDDILPSFGAEPRRRPYEPPAVIEVFIDPAKDMLVACAPGKVPNHGDDPHCHTVQFT